MRRAVYRREKRELNEIVVGGDEEGLGTRARPRRAFIATTTAHHVGDAFGGAADSVERVADSLTINLISLLNST